MKIPQESVSARGVTVNIFSLQVFLDIILIIRLNTHYIVLYLLERS